MSKYRWTIGFDSDGVLDNFSDGVHEAMIALGYGHLWKSGPTPKSFWNYYEDWGWTFAQFKELVDWGVDNGYIFTGHWREGAKEAVDRVRALGHRVVIITDRAFGSDPLNSQRNTITAYARAGIEYDDIYFTRDKTSVWTDMMVEDKLENFDALEAAGTDVYLINRAWNEPWDDHRKRIDNVLQFASIVEVATLSGMPLKA